MDKHIKGVVLFLFMLVSAFTGKAYNSDDVFFFKVPTGATIEGIARDLSIPIDTLMKYNPELHEGLTGGMQLHLPATTISEERLKKVDSNPTFVSGALSNLCNNDTLKSNKESKVAINAEVLSEENPNDNNEGVTEELRAVVGREGKVGFVNEHGKEVIPLMYDDATNFYNGFAYVRKGNNHYLIDKDGNIIADITSYMPNQYMGYKYSYGSYNPLDGSVYIQLGKAYFESDPKEEYITWDTNGKVQEVNLELPKRALWSTYSGILNSEVRYFITNKMLKPAPSSMITADGKVTIYSIGVYDKDYNLKFSSTAKDLHPFSNGLARITDFKKTNAGGHGTSIKYKVQYGFVDLTGRKLPNCNYDYAMDFSDGLARVAMNGKSGYIDTTGNVVIPFTFDGEMPQIVDKSDKEFWETSNWQRDMDYNIGQFNNGLAIQSLNGQYVIINKDGKIINPLSEFKGHILFVKHFNNGIIVFYSQPDVNDGTVFEIFSQMGYSAYDINGHYIVPHKQYSYIGPFITVSK